VVELLGGVWTWAAKREHVAPLSVKKGVDRVKSSPKARALSPTELKTLGEAVRTAEPKDPMAAAAPKLLALTGMRRQEAVKLMWSEYDRAGSCLHLGDTKTGRSTRPLGAAAAALLDAWAASGTHPTLVFPNARGNGPADLKKKLAAIFDAAGLQGVRSHALRSTFASADSIARGFGRDIAAEGLRLAADILQGRLQGGVGLLVDICEAGSERLCDSLRIALGLDRAEGIQPGRVLIGASLIEGYRVLGGVSAFEGAKAHVTGLLEGRRLRTRHQLAGTG
jgi:hypothetical protein